MRRLRRLAAEIPGERVRRGPARLRRGVRAAGAGRRRARARARERTAACGVDLLPHLARPFAIACTEAGAFRRTPAPAAMRKSLRRACRRVAARRRARTAPARCPHRRRSRRARPLPPARTRRRPRASRRGGTAAATSADRVRARPRPGARGFEIATQSRAQRQRGERGCMPRRAREDSLRDRLGVGVASCPGLRRVAPRIADPARSWRRVREVLDAVGELVQQRVQRGAFVAIQGASRRRSSSSASGADRRRCAVQRG